MRMNASRSPSWGAWIEIESGGNMLLYAPLVAPPRGERGLKSHVGGAAAYGNHHVAPPRGERGLKYARQML